MLLPIMERTTNNHKENVCLLIALIQLVYGQGETMKRDELFQWDKMVKATQKIISLLPDLVDLRFLSGFLITETCSYFATKRRYNIYSSNVQDSIDVKNIKQYSSFGSPFP